MELESVLPDLDHFIQTKMKEFDILGMSLGIIEGQEVKYVKSFGFKDIAPLPELDHFIQTKRISKNALIRS